MTPKQKCDELFELYSQIVAGFACVKKCCKIAANSIVDSHDYPLHDNPEKVTTGGKLIAGTEYWKQVKEEIEKL